MPEILAPDVSRVGAPLDRILRLGSRVLRPAAGEGKAAEYGDPLARVQMDSHPFSLLEGPQAVRRSHLSTSIHRATAESTADRCSCGTPVEKCRWVQQNRAGRSLTEKLRCLSSYQAPPFYGSRC